MTLSKTIARPFVKWAGGKTQLLPQLHAALPDVIRHTDFNYYEPFLGGGAMLFFMLQTFPNINKVTVSDINPKLIHCFKVVKNNTQLLIDALREIENSYLSNNSQEKRAEYYMEQRRVFNSKEVGDIEQAALFIFLNKTCFNGLYRENSKGEFNVPHGRYKKPQIRDVALLVAVSRILNERDVNIVEANFIQLTDYLSKDNLNFIYFDPPFRPLNKTSHFNTYVSEPFDDEQQIALASLCRMLSQSNNNYWMLSNADCSAVNPEDRFFENLYDGFNIQRVLAKRHINAIGDKRGELTELLMTNYDYPVTNKLKLV